MPGEDGKSALDRFNSFRIKARSFATPVNEYCESVVSKILQQTMPYEIYEASQAGIARVLSNIPCWLTQYLLKKRMGFDRVAKEVQQV